MANKLQAVVPLNNIELIELYDNSVNKYSMSTIISIKHYDYVINGGLFEWKNNMLVPCCNVKCQGVVKSNPNYTEYGYAFDVVNGQARFDMKILPTQTSGYQNYIGCVALIVNGNPQDMTNKDNDSGVGGKRGRTALARNANGDVILFCSKDGSGSSNTYYPSELRDYFVSLGYTDALMLDGGLSSQCNFLGDAITSSRPVSNLIGIKLKNQSSGNNPPVPPTSQCPYTYTERSGGWRQGNSGESVRWIQWHLKFRFGYNIAVDGDFGPATNTAVRNFQSTHNLTADGIVGPATHLALLSDNLVNGLVCPYSEPTVTVQYGNTGNNVRWVQWYLVNKFGYSIDIDGDFGPMTRNAVNSFKTSKGLVANGIVDSITRNAMLA